MNRIIPRIALASAVVLGMGLWPQDAAAQRLVANRSVSAPVPTRAPAVRAPQTVSRQPVGVRSAQTRGTGFQRGVPARAARPSFTPPRSGGITPRSIND